VITHPKVWGGCDIDDMIYCRVMMMMRLSYNKEIFHIGWFFNLDFAIFYLTTCDSLKIHGPAL
jgi:hypothetical protein